MFSAFQTFGKLGALASSVARAWSPLALWPDGISTAGMWSSPSTLPASFNDFPGTTPVATPGTVADSANPVGLILDRKGGLALGPEIAPSSFNSFSSSITNAGALPTTVTATSNGAYGIVKSVAITPNKYHEFLLTWSGNSSNRIIYIGDGTTNLASSAATSGTITGRRFTSGSQFYVFIAGGLVGESFVVNSVSVREIPGNHMLQASTTARPLLSAYDGQTLGPGNTYDATGYPIYQKYDGTDDGMATASFAAGTLTSGMDCLIAVRRDSAANAVCGLYESVAEANKVFGIAESGSSSGCVGSGAGTPTVWVDNTQLTGGTAVTRGTLHTALTAGTWHILELRGLDLSTWTAAGYGKYTSYKLLGARGDIMLYPSTASTTDKDAARQYLADKYGVTLP